MRLYTMLFGRFCKPVGDDGGEGGGGASDRGDSWTPTETPAEDLKKDLEEDDVETATGAKTEGDGKGEDDKGEDEQARHENGKFAKKGEGTMIPKARFDEQVRKEREARETAERKLAELERQQKQIKLTADVGELEKKVSDLRDKAGDALVAGDKEQYKNLSAEADRLNRQIAIQQSSAMTDTAKEQALEDMRFDVAVESIKTQFAALDEDNEAFNQDLVDDVLDKQRGYMEREHLSPSKALMKAAKYVMDREARNQPAKEDKDEGAAKTLDDGKRATDRKKAAVEKNLDASRRQPGSTREIGMDSDKAGQTKEMPSAAQMTYEEFAALPEATKAKMRGDLV